MTGAFLASFILMGVFLLPYFAYIFGRDIPFSRTTLDIGNLLWPLAIFAVLLYEDKKGKLGIWRNPSLGMNLKTAILSLVEKPRAFDPRGQAALTPSGKI